MGLQAFGVGPFGAGELGSLKAGKYTLRLSGVGEEHDVVLTDGFFIASPSFKITAAEVAQTGIIITSDGYVGLQNATTVNQESNPILRLVARGFAKEPHATLAIGKTAESATPMKEAGTETTPEGAVVMKFELPPKLDDGGLSRCRGHRSMAAVHAGRAGASRRAVPRDAGSEDACA